MLFRSMVNVGGGGVNRLKERGDEIKVILGEFEKFLIPGDLVSSTSASEKMPKECRNKLLVTRGSVSLMK